MIINKMKGFFGNLLSFVSVTIILIPFCIAEDILGCGGFIKSHTDIDFTQIRVKL